MADKAEILDPPELAAVLIQVWQIFKITWNSFQILVESMISFTTPHYNPKYEIWAIE